jgi:hypothetical protein
VGDKQDRRRSGVATAGGVRLILCSEVSRWRQQLVRLPESRERTGRREENKGGEGEFADFVVEVVNLHDLHDRQLRRTKLAGGCPGLTHTGLAGGCEATPGDSVGVGAESAAQREVEEGAEAADDDGGMIGVSGGSWTEDWERVDQVFLGYFCAIRRAGDGERFYSFGGVHSTYHETPPLEL